VRARAGRADRQVDDSDEGMRARVVQLARHWHVEIETTVETVSSLVSFGRRASHPVVLKVVKRSDDDGKSGDEWRSGEVVRAFGGRGMVRLLESADGASLLERIVPGTELVELTRCRRDDDATLILADVIGAMTPEPAPSWCATVAEWGRAFDWYIRLGDTQIPLGMVHRAAAIYATLCETQAATRLLHGDLHHYNVLDGGDRGWVSIDPKGVIGEVAYEIGAALRNPAEAPEIFGDRTTIEKRVATFSSRLGLDTDRALRWAYAQGVLSAIWHVEDGFTIGPDNVPLVLARAVEPMLGA